MGKYIIEASGNVNWMALFALITFFTVFSIGVLLVFRNDKSFIKKMANLPLDGGEVEPTIGEKSSTQSDI